MAFIQVSDLAASLRREGKRTTALLLGFEGSATLLGVEKFTPAIIAALQVVSKGGAIRKGDISNAWRDRLYQGRYGFMQTVLGPAEPPGQGLIDLARIIRHSNIGIIVATDPCQAVHNGLVRHGALAPGTHFSPTRIRDANALTACIESMKEKNRPWLLDAGEILVDAFIPGMFDEPLVEIKAVRTKLLEISRQYLRTICWGWSKNNIEVGDIWGPSQGQYFVLGKDSEHDQVFVPGTNYDVCDLSDSKGDIIADVKLLKALADELSYSGAAQLQNGTSHVAASISAPTGYSDTPRGSRPLLIPERAVEEMVRLSIEKRLAVIGIDGGISRGRLAAAISAIASRNRDAIEQEIAPDIDYITERIPVLLAEKRNIFWLLELSGITDIEIIDQSYLRLLVKELTSHKQIMTLLLVPCKDAAYISECVTNINYHSESFSYRKVFGEKQLLNWLQGVFPKLAETKALASEMEKAARQFNPETFEPWALDRTHLALSRWWRSLSPIEDEGQLTTSALPVWLESVEALFPPRKPKLDDVVVIKPRVDPDGPSSLKFTPRPKKNGGQK